MSDNSKAFTQGRYPGARVEAMMYVRKPMLIEAVNWANNPTHMGVFTAWQVHGRAVWYCVLTFFV